MVGTGSGFRAGSGLVHPCQGDADNDRWAAHARLWEAGGVPTDLPAVGKKAAPKTKRPVFVYMIGGAKVRAPAAAMALIERVKG